MIDPVTLTVIGLPPILPERLRSKVTIRCSGCWDWNSHRDEKGYGQVWYQGRSVRAHRVFYEILVGPIPAGDTIDHLCRNKACVNPLHLEPVTSAENTRRRDAPHGHYNAQKATCRNGHDLDESNTYWTPDGRRNCRTCRREARRRADASRRAS